MVSAKAEHATPSAEKGTCSVCMRRTVACALVDMLKRCISSASADGATPALRDLLKIRMRRCWSGCSATMGSTTLSLWPSQQPVQPCSSQVSQISREQPFSRIIASAELGD